ncbi:MAG: hypothetical protein HY275_08525 [Gemmatimonadetes bacterium]|nr:hypothetical protein [Gemmatimonadota bacterium]
MNFSPGDYDRLEHAIDHGRRVAIRRRGTEYLVIPKRLKLEGGREAVDATHPTTGDVMRFWIDELDGWDVVS